MTSFSSIAFGAPWVLFALAVLPVIWWLLRVTPPAPKKIAFPAVRLLLGLNQSEEMPAKTPLWLLLLRTAIAALVVLSLADPYFNPQAGLAKRNPLVLVVDNGWAAAPNWDDRFSAMQSLASEAERDHRPVVFLPTAPSDAPLELKLQTGAEAQGSLKSITPQPFNVDRARALQSLQKLSFPSSPEIVWLSDSIDDGNGGTFVKGLSAVGSLRVLIDEPSNTAVGLTPPVAKGGALVFRAIRAGTTSTLNASVRATSAQGRFLASQDFKILAGQRSGEISLDLASELRNEIARVEITEQKSAGGTVLVDERWRRRPVGLVSGQSVDSAQPLLSDLFYLDRALQPHAELHQGKIQDLVKSGLSVLVLADVGHLIGNNKTAAADWVAKGGVLIRFAGPRLASQDDDLMPGKLRSGGRQLGSALSWEEPQKLGGWPEASPFSGLTIPQDVTISRQVLSDPSSAQDMRTWAQLADGTPLVTAQQRERGWVVLFHVTANTSWSSLPISGLFVEMLKRVIVLSSGVATDTTAATQDAAPLPPVETLDGFGRLGAPASAARPLKGAEFDKATPGPQHPPGFYGNFGMKRAFNLLTADAVLTPLPDYPAGIKVSQFGLSRSAELKYDLMALAIMLALIDLIVALVIRGIITVPRLTWRPVATSAAVVVALTLSMIDGATADDNFALKASLQYRLAYVLTGDPEIDAMSKAGMVGLTQTLKERTAVEPGEPIAVDIETDEIAFFPLLYWPMSASQPQISASALARIDHFMRNGGTILFDTRDQHSSGPLSATANGSLILRRMLAGLDIPPLQPVTQEHVLSRTFYLLKEYPGRWPSGRVWIEAQQTSEDGSKTSTTASDGVSPLIVGGSDWAAAWARDSSGRPMAAVVPGGERQREIAMRFGVNLVMYTLTGNYKTDQVHVPHILERLGQ